jgi:hypothetical protein
MRFLIVLLALATPLHAHFVFVVPSPDKAKAKVVFSEDLSPEAGLDMTKIAGLKLWVRGAAGAAVNNAAMTARMGEDSLDVDLPKDASGKLRLVFGSLEYGVVQRGESKPFMLQYHPKAILGPASAGDSEVVVGKNVPTEIVPVISAGQVRFRMLAEGKPLEASELTVILPDGKEERVMTDKSGLTPAFSQSGRFGAWGRYSKPLTGEHGGKKYDEVRHYATLVVDVAGK